MLRGVFKVVRPSLRVIAYVHCTFDISSFLIESFLQSIVFSPFFPLFPLPFSSVFTPPLISEEESYS